MLTAGSLPRVDENTPCAVPYGSGAVPPPPAPSLNANNGPWVMPAVCPPVPQEAGGPVPDPAVSESGNPLTATQPVHAQYAVPIASGTGVASCTKFHVFAVSVPEVTVAALIRVPDAAPLIAHRQNFRATVSPPVGTQ